MITYCRTHFSGKILELLKPFFRIFPGFFRTMDIFPNFQIENFKFLIHRLSRTF